MSDTHTKIYNDSREMTETYKGHIILSGARSVLGGKWKPTVQIYWDENSAPFMKSWMEGHFEQSFSTDTEAEMEGHTFAKKWIDDGKPDLKP